MDETVSLHRDTLGPSIEQEAASYSGRARSFVI